MCEVAVESLDRLNIASGDRVGPRLLIDIELEHCKNEADLVLKMAVLIIKVQG